MTHRARLAIVHIGAPRAGSTRIQHAFAARRDALAEEGVLYPLSCGAVAHGRLAAAMTAGWRLNAPRREQEARSWLALRRLRAGLAAALTREVAAARPEVIVLSSEHLLAEARPRRLAALLSPLAEEVRVVACLRRQDEAVFSAYLNALRVGRRRDFTPPERSPPNDPYAYHARLAPWGRAFGREALILRRHDRAVDPAALMFGLAGVGLAPPEAGAVNASLDEVRARFMQRINAHAPRRREGAEDARRGDLSLAIDAAPALGAAPRLTDADAEAIMALYAEENRRLSEDYFGGRPVFRPRAPDAAPSGARVLEIDDVVAIAAQLWTHKQETELRLRRRIRDLAARGEGRERA